MAPPARGNLRGVRHCGAEPMQLHGSRRTITTLEHLIEQLQRLFGPEDTLIVAVACHLLSTQQGVFS